MSFPKFFNDECPYHVSSYYYRVEFQQRGAPHIHSLLWLQDKDGNCAPTFWTTESDTEETEGEFSMDKKIKELEKIATQLISASEDEALCDQHRKNEDAKDNSSCDDCFHVRNNFEECSRHRVSFEDSEKCDACRNLKNMVKDFQTHNHTFTCKKKGKAMTIKKKEGHGRGDGLIEGNTINNHVQCRFNFPQFPLNRTMFILGMSKDLDDDERKQRKEDLKKIKKFLIRHTLSDDDEEKDIETRICLEDLTFLEFLLESGMFKNDKKLDRFTISEKKAAYQRYLDALSASVRGTGSVFMKRKPKDVFTNNFNSRLLAVHKANHDLQIVVDQVSNIIYYCFNI